MLLEDLKGIHEGETAYIVGKGPSLKYLTADHFGAGPILTINESILIVQSLGLDNPIFSMQKDGDAGIGHAVYPWPHIPVILQRPGYSENSLPNHLLKIFVNPKEDFGFHHREMSLRICLRIALLMGCNKIIFICCDSLTSEDYRRLDVETGEIVSANSASYARIKKIILEDVKDMPHDFIVPSESDYPNLIKEYDQFYLQDPNKWTHAGHDRFVFDTVKAFWGDDQPGSLIDIGCGIGHTLQVFTYLWVDVDYWGVDLSPEAVKIAGVRLPQVKFIAGMIESIDLPKFDVILLVGVLEHIKDHAPALKKIKSILKPGGIVYMEVPNCLSYPTSEKEEGYRRINQGNKQFEWHLKRLSWQKIILDSGLRIEQSLVGPSVYNEFIWILKG